MTKLNIGAGPVEIEGFTSIDRKLGNEAYPLKYEDNSVEEIRASHVLEHFNFKQANEALADWVRVLKPGGRIRIAVPDFEKITTADERWPFFLMGGQTDEDDFHKSVFNRSWLVAYMKKAGLEEVDSWQDETPIDTASHPVSLRLQGIKPPPTLRICALMSIPRVGWNDNWGCILEALRPFQIPVHRFTGVFWGQCMQRGFEECIEQGVDWVLTIDYDSVFYAKHLNTLLGEFGNNPEIDALAAMQSRRGQPFPLATVGGQTKVTITEKPLKVTTAHFGLTLIRMECFKNLEKPWFFGKPDDKGEWGDDRMDDDIWFWHQWRKAGHSIYISPSTRIGHLEMVVSEFDDDLKHRQISMPDWRTENASEIAQTVA